MKQLIIIILAIAGLTMSSCESESGKLQSRLRRIKVLENGTISYVILNAYEAQTLYAGDTIWVNPAQHEIDEISDSAMQAVIVQMAAGGNK